ncbi:MAG: hypothetical protein K2N03_05510 [Muribaculaceae bacterium]|nr:hypothetical protein [Muribaculaceae bacterium]
MCVAELGIESEKNLSPDFNQLPLPQNKESGSLTKWTLIKIYDYSGEQPGTEYLGNSIIMDVTTSGDIISLSQLPH